MALALQPTHLRRYLEIARLLWKYARPEIRRVPVLELPADAEPEAGADATDGTDLARDLERMGPTFIKLGQVLSTRPDLLAQPQLDALARLQDQVEPFPFAAAREVLEEELGARLSKLFADFEEQPIAAASLGQVHRARLRDGRLAAVKVQRPDVRGRVAEDLEVLQRAAALLDRHTSLGERYRFVDLIEEFRRTLQRELDYTVEAANMERMAQILEPFPHLLVPAPFAGLSTGKVLTMEYVQGRKITDVSPLGRIDFDGVALADQLFAAYLDQILVRGFFHADPHPGNVFLTDDGRLALLDLGMVGRLTPEMQERLLRLLLATSDGRGEEVAELAQSIGEPLEHFDAAALRRSIGALVADNQDVKAADLAAGRVMLELHRVSSVAGLRLPAELALLGKTLLQLDEIGRLLAPEFDPNKALREHAAELSRKRMRSRTSLRRILATSHDLAEFAERLPARANRILDKVANNELSVRVEAIDHELLLQGAQTVANRIVLGLVLAALIVGASMLMRVETPFRILGYPGLAMMFFLAAATGGVALALNIVFGDVHRKPQSKNRR
jgi:predicted unusual protein kinase regulating ubiquinone biosynthesis (AarF/ABC1/UbiB family)